MNKAEYEILNYWNNNGDIYVDYIVTNTENDEKAHACSLFDSYVVEEYVSNSETKDINDDLIQLISKYGGYEFNLPKTSELSPLLQYVHDCVCESESDMFHLDYEEWEELKNYRDFTEEDIVTLNKEIEKYNLDDYIETEFGEYKICGYGGLQCCFNDDRDKGSDELER